MSIKTYKIKYTGGAESIKKSIIDLVKAGRSKNEIEEAGFPFNEIFIEALKDLKGLRHARSSPKYLKGAGFRPIDLKVAGFSISELNKAGYSVSDFEEGFFSARELEEAGFSVKDLKDGGFSASKLKKAGFLAKELKEAGYSVSDLIIAGFSAEDLQKAYHDRYNNELKTALKTTLEKAVISVEDLKKAGFSASYLKEAGLQVRQLNKFFSVSELKEAGFSASDLKEAGFSASELKAAGFLAKDLFVKVKTSGPQTSDSMSKKLFNAGELKEARYKAKDLKDAGFNICELINTGFSVIELKDIFSPKELNEAGIYDNTQKKDICIDIRPPTRFGERWRTRRFFKKGYNIYYDYGGDSILKLDLSKVIDLNNIYKKDYGNYGSLNVIKIKDKNECMLYNGHIYNTNKGAEIKGKEKENKKIFKYLLINDLLANASNYLDYNKFLKDLKRIISEEVNNNNLNIEEITESSTTPSLGAKEKLTLEKLKLKLKKLGIEKKDVDGIVSDIFEKKK